MSDTETQALALRTQASALLEQARALDGLRPFAVVHAHEYGEYLSLGWGPFGQGERPSQSQCEAILQEPFEENRDESLAVYDFSIAELCGLVPSGRFPALHDARDEHDPSPRP